MIKIKLFRSGDPGEFRRTGQLPVEAQVFLRVMGEDLPSARDLLRDMPSLDRAILLFYIEQIAGLVYEVEEQEGV